MVAAERATVNRRQHRACVRLRDNVVAVMPSAKQPVHLNRSLGARQQRRRRDLCSCCTGSSKEVGRLFEQVEVAGEGRQSGVVARQPMGSPWGTPRAGNSTWVLVSTACRPWRAIAPEGSVGVQTAYEGRSGTCSRTGEPTRARRPTQGSEQPMGAPRGARRTARQEEASSPQEAPRGECTEVSEQPTGAPRTGNSPWRVPRGACSPQEAPRQARSPQ